MCKHCHEDNSWLNSKINSCKNLLETLVTNILHSGCVTNGIIRQWVVSNFNKLHKSRQNSEDTHFQGSIACNFWDSHNIVACQHRYISSRHFSMPVFACPLTLAHVHDYFMHSFICLLKLKTTGSLWEIVIQVWWHLESTILNWCSTIPKRLFFGWHQV